MASGRSGYKEALCSQATDCIDNPLGDKAIEPGDTAVIRGDNFSQIVESSVEPTRSQNITVSCRCSASAEGVPSEKGAAALPLSFRAGHRPEQATPAADRGDAKVLETLVRQARQHRAVDIVVAKPSSYCCIPRLWIHAAMSTLVSRRDHRRADDLTANAGGARGISVADRRPQYPVHRGGVRPCRGGIVRRHYAEPAL